MLGGCKAGMDCASLLPLGSSLHQRHGLNCARRIFGLRMLLVLLLPLTLVAPPALAYPAAVHQQLTFLAARQFNRCVEGKIPAITALQVRYAALGAIEEADAGFWRRTFQWQYYDRGGETERRSLWFIETRLHERFNEQLDRLEAADELAKRYTRLGRIISRLQDVSIPAIVVPVYVERFWAFSMSDSFAEYPLRIDDDDPALAELCAPLMEEVATLQGTVGFNRQRYHAVLTEGAEATLTSVRSSIPGLASTWQVFWRESGDEDDFGSYGEAGNSFGEEVKFSCGFKECHLLHNDPIYDDFAKVRHLQAILSTMRAFLLIQQAPPITAK